MNMCRSDGDKMLFGLDWSHDLQTDLFEKYFQTCSGVFFDPEVPHVDCIFFFFLMCKIGCLLFVCSRKFTFVFSTEISEHSLDGLLLNLALIFIHPSGKTILIFNIN